jgi:hypothetical protein
MNWLLDLLIHLGTTNNYSAIADLHTLQITAAYLSGSVFNSRFLVTDVNSKDSSASRAQVILVRPPPNSLSTVVGVFSNPLPRNGGLFAYCIAMAEHATIFIVKTTA